MAKKPTNKRAHTRAQIEAFHQERMQQLFPDEQDEISQVTWLEEIQCWRVYHYLGRGTDYRYYTELYLVKDQGEWAYLNSPLETSLPTGCATVEEEDVAIEAKLVRRCEIYKRASSKPQPSDIMGGGEENDDDDEHRNTTTAGI